MNLRYRNSVANKFILLIVAFGIVFSAAATGVQLFIGYHRALDGIDRSFTAIETSYGGSLQRALWVHDSTQIEMLVQGISRTRGIAYAAVESEGKLIAAGVKPQGQTIAWEMPIRFNYRGEDLKIGELSVVAGLSSAYSRLFDLALGSLITNAATIFLMGIFAYLVFLRLVTRHLHTISSDLGTLKLDDPDAEMRLARAPRDPADHDELDLLVSAFNSLKRRLRVSQRNVERSREELAASEGRYRAILDEMLDTYYRTDRAGHITMASPSLFDLLGWHPEEMIDRRAAACFSHAEDYKGFQRAFKAGCGKVKAYELALCHRDGHVVWVSITSRTLRDEAGRVIGVEGIARDITEQRHSAEEIRSSRNQLRLVADSLPALILYVDGDLTVRFANRQASLWYDFTVEEMLGRHLREIIEPECRDRLQPYWDSVLLGETRQVSDVFTYADGKTRHLDLRLVPHMEEEGAVYGFFALGLDVTEHHALEEKLRQSQKMELIGQLTGGVAHDFNNLLGIILGNIELLSEDPALATAERMRLLSAVERAGDRGARLTRQLLTFARMQPLEPKEIHLDRDLVEFVGMLKPSIGDSVDVQLVSADNLWPCLADRGLLEAALLNLVINARDAMPGGGRITISSNNADLNDVHHAERLGLTPGPYIAISVRDAGKGIAPHLKERVFEPFFTTKDVGSGTGLGLAMVYGFVTQSGGQVTFESVENEGTTVTLYLPAIVSDGEKNPHPPGHNTTIADRGHGERVLIVEDDTDLRLLTAAMLDKLGYTVSQAHDGPSAVALLQDGVVPDVVLTDIRLPNGLLGPDVVREARGFAPEAGVVYMTGFADMRGNGTQNVGSDEIVINKPFRSDVLAQALNRALNQV